MRPLTGEYRERRAAPYDGADRGRLLDIDWRLVCVPCGYRSGWVSSRGGTVAQGKAAVFGYERHDCAGEGPAPIQEARG